MLGSILSNLLLVMGMCFFLGGIWNWRNGRGEGVEQNFASGTAQTTCSLMALSSASLVIPAAVCRGTCSPEGMFLTLLSSIRSSTTTPTMPPRNGPS